MKKIETFGEMKKKVLRKKSEPLGAVIEPMRKEGRFAQENHLQVEERKVSQTKEVGPSKINRERQLPKIAQRRI